MKNILIFIFVAFVTSFSAKAVHPYHVGSVEFNYNTKSQTFEVTGKFFLDDLENALNKKYGKSIRFNDPKYKAEINKELQDYCENYLKLKINNQFLTFNFVGFEENQESVDIYLESKATAKPAKVETSVSLLYNLFDDQINIIHVIIDGVRKSSKLNYPNRYLYQQF